MHDFVDGMTMLLNIVKVLIGIVVFLCLYLIIRRIDIIKTRLQNAIEFIVRRVKGWTQ